MRAPGVQVLDVARRSPAAEAGIRPGDRIAAVNGEKTADILDVMVFSAEEEFELELFRKGKNLRRRITRAPGESHGMTLEDPPIRSCANDCPFCFVHQNPPGRRLRPGLLVRDDDYRYSFLYGHYVTLTNIANRDLDRIEKLRLSPLYVSVHATNPALRARLFGRKDHDVVPILRRLTASGIVLHTQVVLIPEVNDGEELRRTVEDLAELGPNLASVAVVPVGLTSFHTRGVLRWSRADAAGALEEILELGKKFPRGFIQAADEWYSILAKDPPAMNYYGDIQVEANGVGLVRRLLDEWKRVPIPTSAPALSAIVVSGRSPERWISRIVRRLSKIHGLDLEYRAVENRTFGPDVTVTGLLSWSDLEPVIAASEKKTIVIPDVMLDGENRFLDDVTVREAEKISGKRILVVESTSEGFASLLRVKPRRRAPRKNSSAYVRGVRPSQGGESIL